MIGVARKARSVCDYAVAHGVVDQAFTDPQGRSAAWPNVVVLAAPVNVILDMLGQLPEWHPGEAIVTDIGSTKGMIVEAMSPNYRRRFSPIGGHPICGKEVLGISNAEPHAIPGMHRTCSHRWRKPGRRPKNLLPNWWTAILDAKLLWLSTAGARPHAGRHQPCPLPALGGAGTGYPARIRTFHTAAVSAAPLRLAATPSSMMLDVLQSNQEYVLEAMERVQDQLTAMIDVLKENNGEDLQSILDQSAAQLAEILKKSK